MHEKKKICFQVLDAYSLFNPSTSYPFGGAEFRAYTFLQELHKLSFDVSAVVRNYGQGKEMIEGVNVYPHPYHALVPNRSILERLLHLKLSAASYEKYLKEDIYRRIAADFYCAFEITSASRMLMHYCKENHKKFFLFIASDGELAAPGTGGPDIMHDKREIAAEVITSADKIFVQNQDQRKNLKQNYRKEGILIKNPISINTISSTTKQYDLVWIGKSNQVKRPELFVQLVKKNPHYKCCMILNLSDSSLHKEILKEKPPNLDIIEHLSLEETEKLIARSKVLVSTSMIEGFPNTFLQAGKYRVPVLSMLIDPDGLLSVKGCGLLTGDDLDALSKAADQLLQSDKKRDDLADKMHEYILKEHEAGRVAQQLAAHFV